MVDITPVSNTSVTKSALVRIINHNVMLLQQFLFTIRQISSEFFIFQQDNVPAHSAIIFSHNFARCWAISKILPMQ